MVKTAGLNSVRKANINLTAYIPRDAMDSSSAMKSSFDPMSSPQLSAQPMSSRNNKSDIDYCNQFSFSNKDRCATIEENESNAYARQQARVNASGSPIKEVP